jgi:hypothetical protein
MKSWTGSDDATLLGAPTKKLEHTGIRIRALVATFATCTLIYGFAFGIDALFPDVKNWSPPDWMRGGRPTSFMKSYEWSEVCGVFSRVLPKHVGFLSYLRLARSRLRSKAIGEKITVLI